MSAHSVAAQTQGQIVNSLETKQSRNEVAGSLQKNRVHSRVPLQIVLGMHAAASAHHVWFQEHNCKAYSSTKC